MGYELRPRKVKIVTGPPEAGPLRELWAHRRRPFVAVFWHLRTRWLVQRGVTHARRWWNPLWTTAGLTIVFLSTLALAAWGILGVLALFGQEWAYSPDKVCTTGKSAACAAVTGVLMPAFLLGFSTLLFLFWRLRQVRRYCTYQARTDPSRLVQTAGSLMDEVVGRDQLCNAIMNNLKNKRVRRPHVVVGSVGVGKTALLVRLAQKLAGEGAVPIPVRLRDAQGQTALDFNELALSRFREIVQSRARSEGEVDRAWRWLRQQGDRIVVLADGLEEAFSQDHMSGRRDNLIREGIRRAGAEGLPLVIASRPHEPLRAMQAAVSELEPLSDEAALRYIARSGSWRSDPTLLDRVVEAANMAESPIYLQIAKDLHSKDLLEPLWTGGENPDLQLYDSWKLRAELLETWIHALVDGDVHPELPIDKDTRWAVVEYISALACIGLASDSADVRLGELDLSIGDQRERTASNPGWNERVAQELDDRMGRLQWNPSDRRHREDEECGTSSSARHPRQEHRGSDDWWAGPRVDARIAATWGTRLGLVHEHGDKVRFQHSIVQAYLGSRFLDRMFVYPETAYRPYERHISRALKQGGRELLIAFTLYSRSRKGRCTCGDREERKQPCPVVRTSNLLRMHAKELLADARKARWTAGRRRPTTRDGALDDRGSPRLRALEIYGAAVEIDSVEATPKQDDLVKEIKDNWRHLGQDEDPARLREAKLALVKQCGAAVRRVAAAQSLKPEYEHPRYAAYEVMFQIGCEESDYRVREAIIKEIGAGGEPAYQALCNTLSAACESVETRRKCCSQTVKPSPEEVHGDVRGWQREVAEEREREERRSAEAEALDERREWNSNTMRAWLLPLLVDSTMMSRHLASPRDDLDKWVCVATQEDNDLNKWVLVATQEKDDLAKWTLEATQENEAGIRKDGPGAPIGLGVALAQGFKYAANRRPGSPRSNRRAREFLIKQAQELLKHSTFWYTRLTLLHALTLWSLPDDVNADQPIRGHGANPKGQVREWLSLSEGDQEEHPLVEAAAKLAVRALQTRRPERFLWIDEAALASCMGTEVGLPGEQRAHNLWIPPSTGWSTLDPRAQQLLADVLLLMVLGERSYRPKDLFRLLDLCSRERTQIPSCVRKDRSRLDPVRGAERALQPGSNCTDECRLRMCPYPAKVENLRMEFSEVFCLHQRDLLKKWQPGAWAYLRFHREAPWQRKVPIAGMRRFWDQMSDRARDIDPDDTDTARTHFHG